VCFGGLCFCSFFLFLGFCGLLVFFFSPPPPYFFSYESSFPPFSITLTPTFFLGFFFGRAPPVTPPSGRFCFRREGPSDDGLFWLLSINTHSSCPFPPCFGGCHTSFPSSPFFVSLFFRPQGVRVLLVEARNKVPALLRLERLDFLLRVLSATASSSVPFSDRGRQTSVDVRTFLAVSGACGGFLFWVQPDDEPCTTSLQRVSFLVSPRNTREGSIDPRSSLTCSFPFRSPTRFSMGFHDAPRALSDGPPSFPFSFLMR